jgi:pteridine reductase
MEKIVLITGAARRIGAGCAVAFHQAGFRVLVHCHHSVDEANTLVQRLNAIRPESAYVLQADLGDEGQVRRLAEDALGVYGSLDALINNASVFRPTLLDSVSELDWQSVFSTNLRAPFFLAQNLHAALKKSQGSIVNIVDIYARKPLPGFSLYSVSKAGLEAMTMSLAMEMAPDVRVNGISPGAILWPEGLVSESEKHSLLSKVPLGRMGSVSDIADLAVFLTTKAGYVTGQVVAVDGGRSLSI